MTSFARRCRVARFGFVALAFVLAFVLAGCGRSGQQIFAGLKVSSLEESPDFRGRHSDYDYITAVECLAVSPGLADVVTGEHTADGDFIAIRQVSLDGSGGPRWRLVTRLLKARGPDVLQLVASGGRAWLVWGQDGDLCWTILDRQAVPGSIHSHKVEYGSGIITALVATGDAHGVHCVALETSFYPERAESLVAYDLEEVSARRHGIAAAASCHPVEAQTAIARDGAGVRAVFARTKLGLPEPESRGRFGSPYALRLVVLDRRDGADRWSEPRELVLPHPPESALASMIGYQMIPVPGTHDSTVEGPRDTSYFWSPGIRILGARPLRLVLAESNAYEAAWASDTAAAAIRPLDGIGPLNSELLESQLRLSAWPIADGRTAILWAEYADKSGTAWPGEFLSSHALRGGDLYYQVVGAGRPGQPDSSRVSLTPWFCSAKKVTSCPIGDRRLVVWVGERVPLVIPFMHQGKREERLYARVIQSR